MCHCSADLDAPHTIAMCIVTQSYLVNALMLICLSAGMCVIMGLWAAFLLPETKGVEIESVFRLFQNHWFWGKFPAVKNMSAVSSLPYNTKMGTEANAIGPALVPGAARLSAQPIAHDGNATNGSPLVGGNSKTVI
jgi:hypothetical protein